MCITKTQTFFMKPKVDFCFKELMEDETVRKAFIAAVIGIKFDEIQEALLLPTHLRKSIKEDKLGILDVRVLLNSNIQIDIEIQIASTEYWAERTMFYLGKMFTEQIKEGDDYSELKKCIHIGILDFELFNSEEFYSRFHLWEDSRHQIYSDKWEFHTLELPKLAKHDYPQTELFKWMQFINAETKEELDMASADNPYIKKACENLERISADEEKRLEYEAREKAIRDHNHFMRMSKQAGWNEGLEKGLEKGLEQGLEILVTTCRDLGLTPEDTITRITEKSSLSLEKAREFVEKYW